MRKYLALLLLLPVFAYGASGTACWDGSFTTGSCPVRVLSITPDIAPAATTASITVNLEAAADTLYVWVKAATGAGVCPTAPTVAQVVTGAGSPIFHDDVASPTLGNNVVPLTGLTADTEYCTWAVASKDGIPSAQTHGNSAARTASIPWFTSPVPGNLVKFNPGHYIQVFRNSSVTSLTQATSFAAKKTVFDYFANDPKVEGFVVPYSWGQLETTQGNYANVAVRIGADLDYIKTINAANPSNPPKRLWIRLLDYHWNITNPTTSNYFPSYVKSNGWTYTGSNGTSQLWCRWNTTANDAYIAMVEAIAAEFEAEPLFEAIYLYRETATKQGASNPCSFNKANYRTQAFRLYNAALAAFPTTNVILPTNYAYDEITTSQLMADMATGRMAHGTPDVFPLTCLPGETWGDKAYRGLAVSPGNVDLRGYSAGIYSSEIGALTGEFGGTCTYDQLYAWAHDTMQLSHIAWDRDGTYTYAAIKAKLTANEWPMVQTCPTSYPGCLTGDE